MTTPFVQPGRLRVLITGAAGNIGRTLRRHLRGRYALLRLTDIAPQEAPVAGEEVVTVDIRDLAALEESMRGIDCVIHLAGIPEEDSWERILPMNIEGCYNVLEAARRQGVRREVLASSPKEDSIAAQFHGGMYCPIEFVGDPARIDGPR